MKSSEIKELSEENLKEKILEFKSKYSSLKVSHVVTPLENPMEIRKVRRTVSKLITELNKRKSIIIEQDGN